MAPSVAHWPELPAMPEEGLPDEELPEEEAGEPVGADEPVAGPETPWPRIGERVG